MLGKDSSASSPAVTKATAPGKEKAATGLLGQDARATSGVPAKNNSKRNGAKKAL